MQINYLSDRLRKRIKLDVTEYLDGYLLSNSDLQLYMCNKNLNDAIATIEKEIDFIKAYFIDCDADDLTESAKIVRQRWLNLLKNASN